MGCNCFVWIPRSIDLIAVLLLTILCESSVTLLRHDDVCGSVNRQRIYLNLGDGGVLVARNITTAQASNRAQSSHEKCSLELVTCQSCIVSVTFHHLDLPHRCGGTNVLMDSTCRCDYVWVSEPHNADASGAPFCGIFNNTLATPSAQPVPMIYRSQTRTVSIVLLYSENHQHAFSLQYSAERNVRILNGSQGSGLIFGSLFNESSSGVLTSPFFPYFYPKDYDIDYIITCPTEANCRVRVIFQDFQLASLSIMEFYDGNEKRMEVSSGGVFRPPVILTTGPTMIIRFYANGGTGLGYKAIYSFVSRNLNDEIIKPITDCGGYVENFGGAITMMDMVSTGVKTYDCIWLIRPPKNRHLKTHIYLKVASFLDMGGSTELQVLQGLTSDQPVIETLRQPVAHIQLSRSKEHIIPAGVGFYVTLRGAFSSQSRLAIVYASFSYTDCYTGSDFLCQNHRCIPIQLNCDGFDHCGDNSDEPLSCSHDSELEQRRNKKWYAYTPNYYFPKMDRYPDLKTATMVFVASSLGMILLISALVVLLYHMGSRARQQRELHSQLQSISELLDGAHISTNPPPDEPPRYEAPPDYEEIIKVGLEPCVSTRRKRKQPRRGASPCLRPNAAPTAYKNYGVSSTTSHPDVITSVPVVIDRTTTLADSPPPPYVPTPAATSEPSGSATQHPRLSKRGSKARRSWLLFEDDTSTEDQRVEVSEQMENISEIVADTLASSQTTSVNAIPNMGWSGSSNDEHHAEQSDNNLPASVVSTIDSSHFSDQLIETKLLNSSDESSALHRASYSFDSSASRDGIEGFDVSQERISSQDCCDCQGACGCANVMAGALTNGIYSADAVMLRRRGESYLPVDSYFLHYKGRSPDLRSNL